MRLRTRLGARLTGAGVKAIVHPGGSMRDDIVTEAAAKDEHMHGMASTIVAIQIADRIGHVVWVGDSRAYLWRGHKISHLTQDHSVVEELRVEEGLSETQVRSHPHRNQVTRVLGAGEPEPGRHDFPMRKGDWVLLCSDGLSGELRDGEIATVLNEAASLLQRCLEKTSSEDLDLRAAVNQQLFRVHQQLTRRAIRARPPERGADGAFNPRVVIGEVVDMEEFAARSARTPDH